MSSIYYTVFVELKKTRRCNMSPRTGRPKSDNPKTNDIKVRVNDETLKALNDYCYNNNQTRAEVIRKAIIKFLGIK